MLKGFSSVKRQSFREYFQPSRIVLLVIKSPDGTRVNITTLCFVSHSSYKPASITFALEKRHFSYELLGGQSNLVLAVPGRALVDQTLFCGMQSGREFDKGNIPDMLLTEGSSAEFVWIDAALANIEARVAARIDSGDHDIFVCEVQDYFANRTAVGPNLLSIGKDHLGFELLAQSGIHRIGVPIGAKGA
jgi:flavin reductase (DIM6/NTAB) family NADH-FMN oxidoreductase RutF